MLGPDPEGRSPGRVLVIRVLGLGDLLTAVPAIRAIRRAAPTASLTLVGPAAWRPLLPLIGAVDELVEVESLDGLRRLEPPPDLGVNLHGRGPQSIAAAKRAGAARLLTHHHPAFGLDGPGWDENLHETERWCRLVRWAGAEADPTDLRLHPPAAAPSGTGVVVVHPGAASPARRWPVERYAAVARHLAGRGHRVVATGGGGEVALADAVTEQASSPGVTTLAGRLDLEQLAALVAAAGLVVCGDTGVAHLASAYATPSVVLFGPTPPALWGPPATGPHTVLWTGGSGDPHADRPDPGLLRIGVAEVIKAAEHRLSAPFQAPSPTAPATR